jgi:hypothetical protein
VSPLERTPQRFFLRRSRERLTRFLRPKDDLHEIFFAEAEKWLGHRCRLGTPNEFGRRAGYDGLDHPWDGAFLDCVVFDAGLAGLPSLTDTVAGLAELLRRRRTVSSPRRGDVVFFAFPAAQHFAGPHVGLVADGSRFRDHGELDVLEAQVGSPQARGPKDADGIYIRRRNINDVLVIVRPALTRRPGGDKKELTGINISISHLQPGKASASVEIVQRALLLVLASPRATSGVRKRFIADGHAGMAVTRKWDGPTKRAFARYQRRIGFAGPDATGDPTIPALRRLAEESGLFRLDG